MKWLKIPGLFHIQKKLKNQSDISIVESQTTWKSGSLPFQIERTLRAGRPGMLSIKNMGRRPGGRLDRRKLYEY